ncbi:MAG: hypothetical protein JO027_10780 [Solirubrobacterales bacterium]|nr:hypothetical protein [Solirubrobacterales bacterium]
MAAIAFAMVLPTLVVIVAPLGGQAVVTMFWAGFGWGLLLVALSQFVLFQGGGLEPGSTNDDDGGPGPEDDRPTPPAPIGGIPLPDAGPWRTRVRDHHRPPPPDHPRRPVREREPRVPHFRQLRLSRMVS